MLLCGVVWGEGVVVRCQFVGKGEFGLGGVYCSGDGVEQYQCIFVGYVCVYYLYMLLLLVWSGVQGYVQFVDY